MLNDYKPTHDPNLDTFKVQYLLGLSALLAILFPEKYTPYEVSLFAVSFCLRGCLEVLLLITRFFGHFRYGLNPSLSYPNCLCCNGRVKLIQLLHTTFSRLEYIVPSTFQTGFIATFLTATSMLFQWWLESFKQFFTWTFSTYIIQSRCCSYLEF